jgi:threonine synthase
MLGRDGAAVAKAMESFRDGGSISVDPQRLAEMRDLFDAGTLDDRGTLHTIGETWGESGVLLDPHSAVGVAVGRQCRRDEAAPLVTLATAHPAKFPDAVAEATGIRPALPDRLADLFERSEKVTAMPNHLEAVQDFIRARVSLQGVA